MCPSPAAATAWRHRCPRSPPGLDEAAQSLAAALARIAQPLELLVAELAALLDAEAERLESAERQRIETVARGIERRVNEQLNAWRSTLATMAEPGEDKPAPEGGPAVDPEGFVLWFAISRFEGRDTDVGMHCHHVDPTIPFAAFATARAHGALITSATLRDGSGEPEQDWAAAAIGGRHLKAPAVRAALPLRLRRADPCARGDRRAAQRAGPRRGGLPRTVHGLGPLPLDHSRTLQSHTA